MGGQITGVNFTATDAIAMLQLCSYETQALGYSAFCELFSEEDFLNYEYYYDLVSSLDTLPPNTPFSLLGLISGSIDINSHSTTTTAPAPPSRQHKEKASSKNG